MAIPCNCADCQSKAPLPKKKIAVIGSGASGLTVMKELTSLGHKVSAITSSDGNSCSDIATSTSVLYYGHGRLRCSIQCLQRARLYELIPSLYLSVVIGDSPECRAT